MITKSGGVKLVDFGLVNLSGRSVLTQEGTTLGTMAYMVPEQTQGAGWDHRTDIWALGAVLYEMVSGQQPFKGDYEQVVAYSIMNEEAEPADGSAHRRSYGIGKNRQHKALEKDRKLRYQSAVDLLADLKKLVVAVSLKSIRRFIYRGLEPHEFMPMSKKLVLTCLHYFTDFNTN